MASRSLGASRRSLGQWSRQQQLKVQQAQKKEQLQKEASEVLLVDEDGEEEAGDGVSVADAVDLVQDPFSLFE